MKTIYILLLTGTLLTATEFTNREKGEFAGLGFGVAQKIDMQDKSTKKQSEYEIKKMCQSKLKEYEIFKSYKDKYGDALAAATQECVSNLQKLNQK